MLPQDVKPVWEKMRDLQYTVEHTVEMDVFSTGVRFGAELILEILLGKSENFQEKVE